MKDKAKGNGGSGNLKEGLSSRQSFNGKDGCAKPTSNGRAAKRPVQNGIKGRS